MYWTTNIIRDYPSYYSGFETVAVDDTIYSFNNNSLCLEILVIDTNKLELSVLPDCIDIYSERSVPPDVPRNRFGYKVVAYDKKIYLWGGINDKEVMSNTLYCFNTKTLNWSRPQVSGIIPSARYNHSACISKHQMYIFGGRDSNIQQYLNDVWCLHLKTMNWSNIITTGAIPSPRGFHGATIVDNFMYIFGGYDRRILYSTDIMYLDLISNRWHPSEANSLLINFLVGDFLFVHNNIIYIIGCCYGLNNLYYLDTERNHWNLIKPRGKSPKLRMWKSCTVIGDKMFLISGTSAGVEIHVLDFNPSLKTLATMLIIENGLDFSCLPTKLRFEIDSMRQH